MRRLKKIGISGVGDLIKSLSRAPGIIMIPMVEVSKKTNHQELLITTRARLHQALCCILNVLMFGSILTRLSDCSCSQVFKHLEDYYHYLVVHELQVTYNIIGSGTASACASMSVASTPVSQLESYGAVTNLYEVLNPARINTPCSSEQH